MKIETKERLKSKAVRMKGKEVFYFDENGIYQTFPKNKVIEGTDMPFNNIFFRSDGSFCVHQTYYYDFECINSNIVKMALARMQVGDNFETLEKLFETCKPVKREKPKGIDRLICKIEKPIFSRIPENQNEATFDYIHVDVCILSEDAIENRDEYIKEHIGEIKQRVIEKISNLQSFKKYGVPINILKLSKLTLIRRQSILAFVFEIKEAP